MILRCDEESMEGVDVAFFCGTIEESRPLVEAKPPASIGPFSEP